MELRKYRWSKHYESAEEELTALLAHKGIKANRWSAEPFETYELHSHDTDRRIWCAEGGIVFTINGRDYSLQPGDTFDLPANTYHQATVGLNGCGCYEQIMA